MSREVTVRIDRLVLRGLPPGVGHRAIEGLRAELERELAVPGALERLQADGATPSAGPDRPASHRRPPSATDARGISSALARGIVEARGLRESRP